MSFSMALRWLWLGDKTTIYNGKIDLALATYKEIVGEYQMEP